MGLTRLFGGRKAAEEAEPAGEQPATDLELVSQSGADRARIRLNGELDLGSAPAFVARLAELEAGAPELLEIDLRGLTFMDSSGLAELFGANRRARERGGRIVIVKDHGPIERVLNLARVEDVIDVVDLPTA
jgi:anti-anti-sigma factor